MKNGAPVLDNSTVRTITILGRAGQTLRSIERATGIRRERVSKILKGQGIRCAPRVLDAFPHWLWWPRRLRLAATTCELNSMPTQQPP